MIPVPFDVSRFKQYSTELPVAKNYNLLFDPAVTVTPSLVAEVVSEINSFSSDGVRVIYSSLNRFRPYVEVSSVRESLVEQIVSSIAEISSHCPSPVAKMGNTREWDGAPDRYFATPDQNCTPYETVTDVTRFDVTGTVPQKLTNRGSGATLIVWDGTPPAGTFSMDEYTKRQGGHVEILYPPGRKTDPSDHGAQTTSVAAGYLAGSAAACTLQFMGLTNDPFGSLDFLEYIINPLVPTVVNMSFAYLFNAGTNDYNTATSAMQNMVDRSMGKLAFVVAAGNSGADFCSATGAVVDSYTCGNFSGDTCVPWPTLGLNKPPSALPYFLVGATVPMFEELGTVRALTSYSNRGSCVSVSHDGALPCAYTPSLRAYGPTNGTSFSAPRVASMMAILMSGGVDSRTAMAALVDNTVNITGLPAGMVDSFAQIPAAYLQGTDNPVVVPSMSDNITLWTYVGIGVAAILFVALIYDLVVRRRGRGSGKRKSRH
jgi:hypothetical protein